MSAIAQYAEAELNIEPEVLDKVVAQIRTLQAAANARAPITTASLLIEDLGLDSLKFVDLTVRLEEALGIAEFPMQDWVDGQLAAARPLNVGELVVACQALLA